MVCLSGEWGIDNGFTGRTVPWFDNAAYPSRIDKERSEASLAGFNSSCGADVEVVTGEASILST